MNCVKINNVFPSLNSSIAIQDISNLFKKDNAVFINENDLTVLYLEGENNIEISEIGTFYVSDFSDENKAFVINKSQVRHEKYNININNENFEILGWIFINYKIKNSLNLLNYFKKEIRFIEIEKIVKEKIFSFIENSFNEDVNKFKDNMLKKIDILSQETGIDFFDFDFIGNLENKKIEEKTSTVIFADNDDDDFLPMVPSTPTIKRNICPSCGWEPPVGLTPKFCLECGTKWY